MSGHYGSPNWEDGYPPLYWSHEFTRDSIEQKVLHITRKEAAVPNTSKLAFNAGFFRRKEIADHLKMVAFQRNVGMEVDETRYLLSSTYRCNLTGQDTDMLYVLKYAQEMERINPELMTLH